MKKTYARALGAACAACVALTLSVLAAGCNRGSGGGGTLYCSNLQSKLRGCGLLSEGVPPACTEPGADPSARCFLNCFLGATCEELSDSVCGMSSALYMRCESTCGGMEANFTCDDGSTIPASWQCDGGDDCADGSDEAGCPTFACADGDTVAADARCDGFPQCADESDEVGCPSFTCSSGETRPANDRCNFSEDCADGSDEVGCAMLVCM